METRTEAQVADLQGMLDGMGEECANGREVCYTIQYLWLTAVGVFMADPIPVVRCCLKEVHKDAYFRFWRFAQSAVAGRVIIGVRVRQVMVLQEGV